MAESDDSEVRAAGGEAFAAGQVPWRQVIKVVVYGLLLVNFVVYVSNDWTVASHTAKEDWTLLKWAGAFATTLDEAAWFVLLFLFELETYLLDDDAFTRRRVALMHGLRLLCILFIGHTVYAFGDYVVKLAAADPMAAASLCEFAARDVAYAFNLTYTPVDAANCERLSTASTFYLIEEGTLVTDPAGMRIEGELAVIDLIEVVAWIAILFLIELTVRLQDRGITGGTLMRGARSIKMGLYGLLWLCAAYWLYRGHWIFAWDEALWILGFVAIDMNIDEWREEIDEEQAVA
jgi:hypothetical protein